jgi:hypothetical protein
MRLIQIPNRYIYLVVFVIMFSSCTEEIDINLNSIDQQIVVEGSVPTSGNAVINLTKSVNFDQPNEFPKVQNATVQITDSEGKTTVLLESSPGFYRSGSTIGKVGLEYDLLILLDDKTIEASSSIPEFVQFDSLIVAKADVPSIPGVEENDDYYEVNVSFVDPVNKINQYRFSEYVNGSFIRSHVYDDRQFDGNKVTLPLLDFSRKLYPGDSLVVEMQCIDRAVFEYFNSIENTQQSSAAPANPLTNISGTDLGYFSAHTSEVKLVLVR